MTRDELIARIEAGETGPSIDMEVARASGLHAFLDGPEAVYVKEKPSSNRQTLYSVKPYTTSIDAAVSLVGECMWSAFSSGASGICIDFVSGNQEHSYVPNNPAAALVAAWLRVTI